MVLIFDFFFVIIFLIKKGGGNKYKIISQYGNIYTIKERECE